MCLPECFMPNTELILCRLHWNIKSSDSWLKSDSRLMWVHTKWIKTEIMLKNMNQLRNCGNNTQTHRKLCGYWGVFHFLDISSFFLNGNNSPACWCIKTHILLWTSRLNNFMWKTWRLWGLIGNFGHISLLELDLAHSVWLHTSLWPKWFH